MLDLNNFKELGLSAASVKALAKKGFEEPTEIQSQCIPLLLSNNINIIGQAHTGTGKTAAFALPILEKVKVEPAVQAIVLTPTRELAIQVAEEINSLKGDRPLQVAAIYGGQSIEQQIRRLKHGVQIVVGTPGRFLDHLRRKTLKLHKIKFVILDEADEMLNMGFVDDIEDILEHTPADKNMLLFSATMPDKILKLANRYMPKFEHVKVKQNQLTTVLTDQIYFEVRQSDKFDALCRIIDIEEEFYGLIFCRTKNDVDQINSKLMDHGYDADALHGDISQSQREKIFKKFKKKTINILVATDVAARGLDVNDLTHVINYALPQDAEGYVHRIGRTGRAGKGGTAITFITPSEYRRLTFIKRVTNSDIQKGKLPKAKDIIAAKKRRIQNSISEIINQDLYDDQVKLATELLHDQDPKEVVAALLYYSFQDDLDMSNYSDIREQSSPDRKGLTRLFVAKGKRDGMSKKKLVEFIQQQTGVRNSAINDVTVLDNFSFISAPFKEAEIVLRAFQKKSKGQKSLVTKAKVR